MVVLTLLDFEPLLRVWEKDGPFCLFYVNQLFQNPLM